MIWIHWKPVYRLANSRNPTPPRQHSSGQDKQAQALRLLADLRDRLAEGARDRIVALLLQLENLAPSMGPQWLALARIAGNQAEVALARRLMALYLDQTGRSAANLYNAAHLLAQMDLWGEALDIMRGIPAGQLDPAALAHSRGTAELYCGDPQTARQLLEEAVRLRPHSAPSWLSLATLVNFAEEEVLADRLAMASAQYAGLSETNAILFAQAMGKMLAERGEHDRAFACFAQSAELARRTAPYDAGQAAQEAAESVAGFDPASLTALARTQTEPTDRTLFVTGLPRSGTTLTAQILTSHSTIAGAAEINRVSLLVQDIGGRSGDAVKAHLQAHPAPDLARLWHRWLDERFSPGARAVDKTIGASRMMGVIAALLPQAPLVWLVRDPLDCAWSCLRNWFNGDFRWRFRQEDMAHHFRLEDDLRRRWQDMLGDRLLVLRYEDLARDPAGTIPRLLAHCGLADEPAVYAPHRNTRAVTTSSVMQVRQPISPMGIGAAAPYRAHLEPFLAAYQA
ncbi:tetratricopeptide repeat-containing sulfotransferase family protein [Alteraurantiacibacter palmitatis]|uniref:Sulfotransferase n=1 Tax=Alteraurantiacibacter palmitatis TaxID=2054628 RepID=A0ABV7EC38_9SPHN